MQTHREDFIFTNGLFVHSHKPGFRTVGKDIIDSVGRVFIPRGVNVGGTLANNGNGWPDWTYVKAYVDGMVAMGCNTVRLVTYVTDRNSWAVRAKALAGGKTPVQADAEVDALADQLTRYYLKNGMVVIMEAHDLTSPGFSGGVVDQVVAFWRRYAERWQHDTRVWFNIANEPNMPTAAWKAFHERACQTVRATGARNIIVVDLLNYAADVGRDYAGASQPYGYHPDMVPALIARHGNIIMSQHNYGTYGKYDTEAKIRVYIARVQQESIPLIYGEVGYPIASQSAYANSGSYAQERGGALNTFKAAPDYGVGVLWWASNFNDNYKLVDVVQGQPLTNEFAPGATLNEAGLAFKQYVQDCNALNQS